MQGGTGGQIWAGNSTYVMPDMLESGTQNGHGIASINAGIWFINKIGIGNIFSRNYVKRVSS